MKVPLPPADDVVPGHFSRRHHLQAVHLLQERAAVRLAHGFRDVLPPEADLVVQTDDFRVLVDRRLRLFLQKCGMCCAKRLMRAARVCVKLPMVKVMAFM